MAEEGNTVVIRMKGAVNASFSFVSVLQEKGIDAFVDGLVFFRIRGRLDLVFRLMTDTVYDKGDDQETDG